VDLYRIDRDTMRTQKRLEAQLTAINQGKRAILIGTQMLAKGHHFPNVTLVAVLNADNGFLSTDFRAPERTAAIITQVAGRSGRASKPGEVYIQTMQPDNPILTSLIEGGYSGFARRELEVRREAAFPPFQPMAMIRAESRSEGKAQQFLHSLASQIPQPLVVLGPAPAPIQRMGGAHRQQLMVQAETRSILHRGLTTLHNAKADRDIRWSIDVDPYDTF
jgi:primosomal protein N' (replication factor Y)